jgi:NO-binding membrane sensor protein with MHYT domain
VIVCRARFSLRFIVGLHFTAMGAASIVRDPSGCREINFAPDVMAVAVALAVHIGA